MKIEVRIPTAQYAYHSIFFDSIEEYVEKYPEYVKAHMAMENTILKVKATKDYKINKGVPLNPTPNTPDGQPF